MKKLGLLIVLITGLALSPSALAAGPSVANGGGRGTQDGTTPFSQFGFGVTKGLDGSIQGSFNCLMAGSSQFPPFTLMAVRGQVTSADIGAGAASFDGVGMLQTGPDGKFPATFHVDVTEGGPGVGTLDLTLITPFRFPVGLEHVLAGQISIR
ncbi:MAG TPA: hypothetical protein VGJ23_00055 [Gaiellaceae bacterium]|jgi:hypothetical protein